MVVVQQLSTWVFGDLAYIESYLGVGGDTSISRVAAVYEANINNSNQVIPVNYVVRANTNETVNFNLAVSGAGASTLYQKSPSGTLAGYIQIVKISN